MKSPLVVRVMSVAGLLFVAGCQKKETLVAAPVVVEPPKAVEVVADKERSRHFLAVTEQLELGGTLYAYVDIDGDVAKLGSGLQGLMKNMAVTQPKLAPYVNDYTAVLETLGLNDVKALGLSSVPDGSGFFRNRMFLYMPEKRRGLLAGLGGTPKPFARLNLAPVGTDVYSESEIELPVVYATLQEVVGQIAGEKSSGQLEEGLRKAGQTAAISALSVIQGWKGYTAMVMRLDPEKNWTLPPAGFKVPAFSLLLAIDGLAPALREGLDKTEQLTVTTEGVLRIYEFKAALPIEGLKPVLVMDGSTLYFATTRAFYDECRQHKDGLVNQADFQDALAHVGAQGNGLGYVSPRFFQRLQQLDELNPQLAADTKGTLDFVLSKFPQPDRPLITVRTNLPNGILVRSYMNRSLKQDIAAITVYNPVTVGLMAAMAIPAFQKVRTSSQEKAILNNLRQLSAAADQYYLENGVGTTTYGKLVGPEREKYIRAIQPVAGEDYTKIVFKQGLSIWVRLPSGKVIKFP